MIQKRAQISVIAVAALAVFAVVAVMLLAGGGPAQATTATLSPDENQDGGAPRPLATPSHATPEPCPGDVGNTNDIARVVDSGHYALFDVWWNDEEKELTNTVCPPSVVHVPAKYDDRGDLITSARDDRSPSGINITAEPPTIIHIPNSAKVTLSASNYPRDKYGKVWEADDAENPNGDGDRMMWVLPACPPKGPATNDLCISYSAALLNPADWNGNIEYIVTHVHQVDIDKQDRRYVLAYDVPEAGSTDRPELRWYSADQDTDQVYVAPGGYDRPMWFFPSRGAYEFQVYIRGNPNRKKSNPISPDPSVTSDFRMYILHVGAEADLSATMAVPTGTPSPNSNVDITITASNAGPDAAPKTKVDVTLPEGLTYFSHNTATGTYANGVWSIGEFANGASATLTITATVDADTRGQDLSVEATISATETVTTVSGTHQVPVPDKTPRNNMATGAITVESITNGDPVFVVERSVAENASAGTHIGDPVSVKEPNGDAFYPSLDGDGKENFEATAVAGGVQIAVARNAELNYECRTNYDLMLQISDRKDHEGNADVEVDDTIALDIQVTDASDYPTLTLHIAEESANATSTTVVVEARTSPGASCGNQLKYDFSVDGTLIADDSTSNRFSHTVSYSQGAPSFQQTIEAEAFYTESDGTEHPVGSDTIMVHIRP